MKKIKIILFFVIGLIVLALQSKVYALNNAGIVVLLDPGY